MGQLLPIWRLSLEHVMASHRRPEPYTPALQQRNTLRVTSKDTHEGRV